MEGSREWTTVATTGRPTQEGGSQYCRSRPVQSRAPRRLSRFPPSSPARPVLYFFPLLLSLLSSYLSSSPFLSPLSPLYFSLFYPPFTSLPFIFSSTTLLSLLFSLPSLPLLYCSPLLLSSHPLLVSSTPLLPSLHTWKPLVHYATDH